MSNKLPWFKHSATAAQDPMIYGLISDFGHFGYSAFFMILELLHRDGVGDMLKITPQQLCFNLRSKRKVVRDYLISIRERSGNKIETKWDDSRNEVIIEVKNFRQWQHNSSSKSGSKAVQKRIDRDREGEEERDRDNRLAGQPAPPPKIKVVKSPKQKTPIQRVVEAYKHSKGVQMDDKAWDKANFSRYSKAAKSLLDCFGSDVDKCAAYIFVRSEELNEKNLDWTLETIARHAYDGMGMKRGDDGIEPMASNLLVGTGRTRRLTHSGEIVSDVLGGIKQSIVQSEEPGNVGGLGNDFGGDD